MGTRPHWVWAQSLGEGSLGFLLHHTPGKKTGSALWGPVADP